MKRRRILLLLALVVVAAGIALFWPRGPKEPAYHGKRLSQWIEQANAQPVQAQNEQSFLKSKEAACKAIRALGTNALPWLMSEFTRPESKWRAAFNRWTSAHPRIGFRFRGRWERARTAALGLAVLGTNAASTLPTLAAYLADEDVGSWAAIAMGGAGEIALPYLMPSLTSTSRTERLCAAKGLGNAVYHSDAAIPGVVQLTHHSNVQVRVTALIALGNAKGRHDLLIPVYKEALSSLDQGILRVAAYAVDRKDEVTKAVFPELLLLLTNTESSVVRAASNTIFHIDPSALPPRGP
jgi:hypothetical protein